VTVDISPVAAARLPHPHAVQTLPGLPPTRHSLMDSVSLHVMLATLPLSSRVQIRGVSCASVAVEMTA